VFDNGKGRMIQRTDIFLVRVGMRGNLVGERVRFFEWIGWQYLRHLESYCTGCHLKTNTST